ncbi:MAG: arylsulfatase [Flavobacteriaceae bacterium]|nr:arylsulfatase [Flavobacteriaceae bacterium]
MIKTCNKLIILFFILTFLGCNNKSQEKPNIVFILTDDLAYADLSSYGSNEIETPFLDKLASDGVKLTSYYAAQAVCSASRAAILTGCYPNRLGISGAFGPKSKKGINPNEFLVSEMLKENDYKTGIFGKWHLGDAEKFLPTNHGFDEFYGILFSNDMWKFHPERPQDYPDELMLYRNDNPIQPLIDQSDLTKNITDESIRFIEENKDNHFFLYIAHPQPHVPLFASNEFKGSTGNGLFADVISEIDFSVGRVMEALEKNNLTENTIIVFTSDNGPWLSYGDHAGSSGIFREGKGTAWEGGQRVPCIIKYPKEIKANTIIDEPVMGIDWMPTFSHITGSKLSENKIDGKNIWPLLTQKQKKSPHKELYFYYRQNELHAVRSGNWKLYFPRTYRSLNGKEGGKNGIPVKYDYNEVKSNELYNLKEDPGESINVYLQNIEKANELEKMGENARKELGDALTSRVGAGVRKIGTIN